MKALFILPLMAAALVACNTNKTQNTENTDNAPAPKVATALDNTSWRLTDYPGETEPVVIAEGTDYVLVFDGDNNTYSLDTDCNTIFGEYTVNGDSIKFVNQGMTMKECPDQQVQTAMNSILPQIDTYAISEDSTMLILRSDMRTMAVFSAMPK